MFQKMSNLLRLAEKVREDFENSSIPREKLINLYSKYNQAVDAENFIETAIRIFPRLNCGLASIYLQSLIKEGKVTRGKYKGIDHTFIMFDDNRVLDITADQYGGPRVYLGKLKKPWSLI
ncbi:MAG: hypothetical protein MRY49_01170 [Candidatus Pacebacteria bacterium]|nr:hypothetical protein [Candidatus Paceibacterota bacterium]